MVYPWLTSTYARNIYLYGTRTFSSIMPEYVEPVKKYAATTFSQAQIDGALSNGWITQTEYDETMVYKAL